MINIIFYNQTKLTRPWIYWQIFRFFNIKRNVFRILCKKDSFAPSMMGSLVSARRSVLYGTAAA
jgi:hypothetical protein